MGIFKLANIKASLKSQNQLSLRVTKKDIAFIYQKNDLTVIGSEAISKFYTGIASFEDSFAMTLCF